MLISWLKTAFASASHILFLEPGGESIYGKTFRDEWEHGIVHHTECGCPIFPALEFADLSKLGGYHADDMLTNRCS